MMNWQVQCLDRSVLVALLQSCMKNAEQFVLQIDRCTR